jgi:predicted RNA-binding protein with RPS1 domain
MVQRHRLPAKARGAGGTAQVQRPRHPRPCPPVILSPMQANESNQPRTTAAVVPPAEAQLILVSREERSKWCGQVVSGVVVSVHDHFAIIAIIALPGTSRAYLPISEFGTEYLTTLRGVVSEGQVLELEVIDFSPKHQKWEVSKKILELRAMYEKLAAAGGEHRATVVAQTPHWMSLKIGDLPGRLETVDGDSLSAIEIGSVLQVTLKCFDERGRGFIAAIGDGEVLDCGTVVSCTVTAVRPFLEHAFLKPKRQWTLYATSASGTKVTCDVSRIPRCASRLNPGDPVQLRIIRRSGTDNVYRAEIHHAPGLAADPSSREPTIGTEFDAEVVSVQDYGAFCLVADGVEGLLHRSRIVKDSVPNLKEFLSVGDVLRVRIAPSDTPMRAFSLDFISVVKRASESPDSPLVSLFDLESVKRQGRSHGFERSSIFTKAIKELYGNCCVMCGIDLLVDDELSLAQAAHIVPRGMRGADDVSNGLCLCPSCHWAFDMGLVSIDQNGGVIVSANVTREAGVGGVLRGLRSRRALAPTHGTLPFEALAWHRRNVFLD